MTLLAAFLLSLVLGGLLVAASLYLTSKGDSDKFSKPFAEMLLKASVVVFGVFIGFVAFFGQKWLEDINKNLDSANEALANLDIIQAEYMSDIESVYYNNDKNFIELYNNCLKAIPRLKLEDDYCEKKIPVTTVPIDTITDGIYYMDFAPPDTLLENFSEKIYSQSFLKRTIITDILKNLFDTHAMIQDRYGVIVDEVKSVRKAGAALDNTKPRRASKIQDKYNSINLFAQSMCCSIYSIHNDSELIRSYANNQAVAFCTIRSQVQKEVSANLDPLVKFFAEWRLNQIDSHVKLYTDKPESACAFTPLPMSE